MDPRAISEIGRTGLRVSRLGLGGGFLGGLYSPIPATQALETVRKALNLGIRYIDTAPFYGLGKSELRIGQAVSGLKRDSFTISTKVGNLLQPEVPHEESIQTDSLSVQAIRDFTRIGVMRSFEGSLKRLGLESIDILFIHGPDKYYHEAINEAYPALAELRSQGIVKAIGVGMTQWEMLLRFAKEGDFDCFLLAGRYTLLEQPALAEFLPYCQKKRIPVMIGGPYNSGILASELKGGAKYNYQDAPPEILLKARRLMAVCDRYRVPLKGAALQFVLAHPAVASVIPGSCSPQEVEENFLMVQYPIPPVLWDELRHDGHIPYEAPVPH